ncbi:MAG: response regulator [Bacteroidetes bacterium]|nr:MAG: response regulator [Bacteroidota bacterium]
MDISSPRNYASFLRYTLAVSGVFFIMGGVANLISAADVWDPPVFRALIALMMIGGAVLIYYKLSISQAEAYAFASGMVCVVWVSLMMYANHLNVLYVVAASLTVCLFPFIFSRLIYIRLLLGSAMLIMPVAVIAASDPVLPTASVASLLVLLILGMYLIAARLMNSRQTLLRNQQELQEKVAELSVLSEQLRLAEERWSYAIDGNQDGVIDWSIPEDHMYVSPSWCKMFGYAPEEAPVRGDELLALLHPDDQRLYAFDPLEHTQDKDPFMRAQFQLRARDGQYKHVLFRGKIVSYSKEGKPLRLVGTHADISAQIGAEEKIRQSERRNLALIDALPDMIFQLNLEGDFIGFKADNESELLLKPEDFIGRHVSIIPFPPEIHTLMMQKIEAARSGGRVEIFEYSIPIGGAFKYYEARIVKCGEAEIVCIVRDVTDRQMKHAALVEAKERAEAAARARSQFLSTMSHEIRTPMNAVIGITHLLVQEDPKPEQLDHLNTLRFAGENLLVIINDILDYSKIESGRLEFEKTDIPLPSLSAFVVRSLQQKADENNLSMSLKVDPRIPEHVIGDPTRLSQVLTNLLNNAIKFTERGEVKMEISLDRQTDHQAFITFSITDTGIGIPEDKLSTIFDSFTQASADHTRKYGGTGLGLAICTRLLELQGSELKVVSEVDKGSTFYFTLGFELPADSNKALRGHSDYEITDFKSLAGTRVLLVEDNLVNQKIAAKFLQKWDIEVETAVNGEKALLMLSDRAYDVVLMDLQMPVMDGYEATSRIRRLDGPKSAIPIIALTADAMQEVRNEVIASGMNDFVSKPFNPRDLYRKIVRFLGAGVPPA